LWRFEVFLPRDWALNDLGSLLREGGFVKGKVTKKLQKRPKDQEEKRLKKLNQKD